MGSGAGIKFIDGPSVRCDHAVYNLEPYAGEPTCCLELGSIDEEAVVH